MKIKYRKYINILLCSAMFFQSCNTKHNNVENLDTINNDTTFVEEKYINDSILDREERMTMLFLCIAKTESDFNANAVNGDCVGVLQISPICVEEVNRILDSNVYSLEDRLSLSKSIDMFYIIMNEKNANLDLKKACEIWNPTAGSWYYEKVKSIYNSYNSNNEENL